MKIARELKMSTIPGNFGVSRTCKCYAALKVGGPLVPYTVTRRAATDDDVVIGIKFAGICHSDIHQVIF
jgi:D-arabinose 1-dehydrogenase-like Zn-dependent alcohol dehydrogenase